MICENIGVKDGILQFAGQSTVELARTYGTPLYLMDEDRVRYNCRIYKKAFGEHFKKGSLPHFASKACAFRQMYRIMAEEKMGVDVVSSGELYTAWSAGYDMSLVCFHGSNKTDADIQLGISLGVGHFIVDNTEDVLAIETFAAEAGIRQKVLIRVTPGIDPHTYAEVATGLVDSKFGVAIETGQADEITALTLKQPHIELQGFHCHVGSQVFGEDVFERSAAVMIEFIAHIRDTLGYTARILDLGGGYGVRYVEDDPYLDIHESIRDVGKTLRECCEKFGVEEPEIILEPGRSIVADAGMTLYTVGAVKKLPGYKNYVSIDGGMADNPRFALYKARYTCYVANKMEQETDMLCDLVGRCCESGDVIQEKIHMPSSTERNDIVAVCTTGAYNYSMASNYNRLGRPPVVMLKDGESYIAVKRESLEDLVQNDL